MGAPINIILIDVTCGVGCLEVIPVAECTTDESVVESVTDLTEPCICNRTEYYEPLHMMAVGSIHDIGNHEVVIVWVSESPGTEEPCVE